MKEHRGLNDNEHSDHNMNKKVVKWRLSEEQKESVDTIALVEDPAIETNFLVFQKNIQEATDNIAEEFFFKMFEAEQASKRRFVVDETRFEHLRGKNLVFAPIMLADKLIIRQDNSGELYYGYFAGEDIRNAAYYFTSNKLIDSWNLHHDASQATEGNQVELLESWIVEDTDTDKAKFFGYNLPKGSWVGILRINDQELYDNYITTGAIKGVSVEAYVTEQVLFKSTKSTSGTGE